MALLVSMLACGIEKGDEVIIPDRTWIATAHAILLLGAVPVIVDTKCISPIIDESLIESVITTKTKAIVPVHMNGRAADMSSIQAIASKYSLLLSKMLHRLLCQKPTIHSWYDWRHRLFLTLNG